MIFIQLVVFSIPRQGSGRKHNSLDKNHITSQIMGFPIYISTMAINRSAAQQNVVKEN
jgi:hypothetical protein